MAQYALSVLERSVLLLVGRERPAHDLEGDEAIRDAESAGDWANAPGQKVLPLTYDGLSLPFPAPKCREHQGLRGRVISTLHTAAVTDHAAPVRIYSSKDYFEVPNWTRDGHYLIFDQNGKIMRVSAVADPNPETLEIGLATRCNGSHVLSPDGVLLAVSCSMPEMPGSRVYTLPASGGTPHLVTQIAGSYWA